MILFFLWTVNVIVGCAPVGHIHAASLKAAHWYNWRSSLICSWLFILGIREEECSMTLKLCEIVNLGFGKWLGFFLGFFCFWCFDFSQSCISEHSALQVPMSLQALLLLRLIFGERWGGKASPFWLHLDIIFPLSVVYMESLFWKVVGQVLEWPLFTLICNT